jgi:phenol 2-monooxygenase
MQDTFNLGWKLVHVLQGRADASLLRTYSRECLTEARRLVETDHTWARIMSAPTTQSERDGTEEPRIIRQFKENLEFTGGTAVRYDSSTLIASPTHQALAKGEVIGRRFHSAPVVRLSDAKQMQLGHVAEADARWRIYAFAGKADGSDLGSAIHKLADWLEKDLNSPVVRHTAQGRGHRCGDRFPGRLPADLRSARIREHAVAPKTEDRQAWPARPRKGLLRRSQGSR